LACQLDAIESVSRKRFSTLHRRKRAHRRVTQGKKLTPRQTSEKNFTLGDAEANSRPNQAEIKKSSRAESLCARAVHDLAARRHAHSGSR